MTGYKVKRINQMKADRFAVSSPGRSFGHYTELFPIPLMGDKSAMIESLASYLNRLSAAHGIAATSLCRNIVFPNMGRKYSNTSTQIPFVGSRAARLLFPNAPSIALTKALGTLTGQSGFDRAITMNLAELVQLGHHVRRGWWWCPLCMQQWIRSGQALHFPLLWNVSTHSVCLEHEVPLIGDCPNCGLQFTQMRENNWSTHCRRCQQSLIGECVRRPSVKVDHQSWAWLASIRTKQLFEWIADGKQISNEGFRRNISSAIVAMGGPSAFARTLNMNYQSVMRWDQGVHRPRFASLIRLSVTFGVSVQEIVETELRWTADRVPVKGLPGKMYQAPLWQCSGVVKTALAKAVSSGDACPVSLTRLCRRFGVAVYSVRRRFPSLSKKLIAKYRRHLRTVSLANRHERTSRLNIFIREIEQNGRRCTRYHLRMLMRERGEKQIYQMLRLFDASLAFKENRTKPSRSVRGSQTYAS